MLVIQEDMEHINDNSELWENFNNKTIMITGANGMLASYLTLAILYRVETHSDFCAKIVVVVRDKDKSKRLFSRYINSPSFTIIKADVCTPFIYDDNIDYIIHGASPASPHKFGRDPAGTILPNVLGTYHLLELARLKKCRGFLYLSSGEVYGKLQDNTMIHEDTLGLVDPLDIRSCYSEGKRAGETLCKIWSEQYGVPAKIARISHTYGPTMDLSDDQRVFSEFVGNVIKNQNIVLKSDGNAERTFCYVSDAVYAFLLILVHGSNGEAYNLCGDESVTVLELANILTKLFPERNLSVIRQERKDANYLEVRFNSVNVRVDNSKLKQLGWRPTVLLKDGFTRTIFGIEEISKNIK